VAGSDAAIARIVAVGDELLLGRTSDTNATRIQRALVPRGVVVRDVLDVGDDPRAIASALARTDPGDLVLVCGGLGSTADDLTREAVAAWAGVPLLHHEAAAAAIALRRRERGLPPVPAGDRSALVPAGLEPVANPVGTAPGLVGRLGGRRLALLPGVPEELQALLPAVIAALERLGGLPAPGPSLLRRTAQLAELPVARLTEPVRDRFAGLRWSWWLVEWGVDIHVSGDAADEADLAAAGQALDDLLGDAVYAREPVALPRVVLDLLLGRGETVAVAESCTGGLIGAALTAEPGSSAALRGGVIAYADAVKLAALGVAAGTLARDGAVSGAVAEAMARGVREHLGADWAVAATGIAGPDGGTELKPVGTTWLAVAGPAGAWSGGFRYSGDRDRNRRLAVAGALDALRRALLDLPVFPTERLSWGRAR
jgi:nicotinamide-nucleotide amidase